MKERKDRVDDAIAATRAALEEGYVPGGGTIQLRASEMLVHQLADLNEKPADFRAGWCVVAEALSYPFRQLCENASANAVRIQVDMELQPWMTL